MKLLISSLIILVGCTTMANTSQTCGQTKPFYGKSDDCINAYSDAYHKCVAAGFQNCGVTPQQLWRNDNGLYMNYCTSWTGAIFDSSHCRCVVAGRN